MCRSKAENGRRCPCDSSSSRRLRRHNSQLQKSFIEQVDISGHPDTSLRFDFKEVSVESVKQDIDALNTLLISGNSIKEAQIDSAVIKVGTGIQRLAETSFGSPTDKDFEDVAAADDFVAKITEVERQKKALVDARYEIYDRLRAQLRAVDPKALTTFSDESFIEHSVTREKTWEAYGLDFPADDAQALSEYSDKISKLQSEIANINNDGPASRKKVIELLKQRNEAFKKALESVGVTLADPKTLKVSDDSHKKATLSVRNALQFYPQAWVDASNKYSETMDRELRIKDSTARAHYSDAREQKNYEVTTAYHPVSKPKGWEPDPQERHQAGMIKVGPEGFVDRPNHRYLPSSDYDEDELWMAPVWEYHSRWGKETQEFADDPGPKPRGRGWELAEVKRRDYNAQEREWGPEYIAKLWRKKKQTRTLTGKTIKSELTVNNEYNHFSEDRGYRVSLHELAHRFESTVPKILRAERAFLHRRTGNLDGAEGEQQSTIYKGTSEKGYKDNFAAHYMGKTYFGAAYELLSVGMESLFSGSHGGLVKQAGQKTGADADYRSFVLGALTIKP